MLENEYHRLLKRQLKKTGFNTAENPICPVFLNMINEAYKSFDKDVNHIEHILEESSKELFVVNQTLRSERDKTRTKLEHLVDNVGGVIFETDLRGDFTFLNNAWTQYSGYLVEESIGRNFNDFIVKENIKSDKKIDSIFLRKNNQIKAVFEYKKEGKSSWFDLNAKLLKGGDGASPCYIGTILDITNLKTTEIELNKASIAKDEFLSTMSHEIRTPLNAVTGLSNILLMETYLPEQEENLKALKYSSEHLLGLINDLLDFSKIKSGKLKVVDKDFSLDYFLENIRAHFSLRANKKGVLLKVIKDNDIPDRIKGDKLKLTQVIKNLLSNSLKFTEKGSITLFVKKVGVTEYNVNLEFKVIDTGIGISKSRQKAIFDSFSQANSEISIKYGGTGLGLSISKKLLNLQGSDLHVKSKLGKGATFSFEIRYKLSDRDAVFESDVIKLQQVYEPLNMNILIAEDNKMNVLILKRFFNKWKVSYIIAENGKEVLELIKTSNFNLILMDLQMPVLDGYETTRIIRNLTNKNKANTPIIALTAFAQLDIKEKTKSYKMNGFMGKPFDPAKLYELLKSYSKVSIHEKLY